MNKTELKYFSTFYVDKLFVKVASTRNYNSYLQDQFPYEEHFAKGPTGLFIDEKLKLNPDKKGDLESSIALYEALKDMTEVEASDERLWVYLGHAQLWNYMRKRWPVEEAKKPLSRIKERYFVRNLNLQSLTRNGLSRLWWYAHITHDVDRANKYELLEILLQRQDFVVGITERAFGANKRIREGLLEFFKDNSEIAANQKQTRELFKALNLFGGVKILPCLEANEIKNVLEKVKFTIAA